MGDSIEECCYIEKYIERNSSFGIRLSNGVLITISRSNLSRFLSHSSIVELVLESCLIEKTFIHCDRKLEFLGLAMET
ncbi:hypothetical protein IMY05_010G0168200 [Salix suchowensis]|nr:hypothetical protein IMY05_010G0168200 [Salix suchowensis]